MPIDFPKLLIILIALGVFLLVLTFLPFWLGIIIIAVIIYFIWKKFFSTP